MYAILKKMRAPILSAFERRGVKRSTISRNLVAYAFLAPSLAFFVVFMIIPVIWTFGLSLQEGGLLRATSFIGLSNYPTVIRDPRFRIAMLNTLLYAVMVIPAVLTMGLFLAVLLRQVVFKTFFKSAVFFPHLSAMAIAAVVFSYMVHPEFGPLNQMLRLLHLPAQNWLGDPQLALPTVALLEIWRSLGFNVIVYVAALGRVPEEIYEAGRLDGAHGWSAFWHITVPLIKPVILFTLVMATVWNLQMFDSVFVLTRGGPVYSTATVVWFLYDNAFYYDKVGIAATIAILLLLVTLVLTLIQVRVLRSEVEY